METLREEKYILQDKAEEAEKISAIYKLLSRIFIREVDAPFLRQLRIGNFYESLKSVGIDLGDEFLSQNEEELLEDMAVEYARLFIVPGIGISPYESVYREGRFYGESTQAVKDFYRRCRLKIGDESLMPDHIGLEMELMSYLKQKEAESLKNGKEDTSRWLELQKEFTIDYLDKWTPQFFTAVEETAEHPFYKEMAKLGKRLREYEWREHELHELMNKHE